MSKRLVSLTINGEEITAAIEPRLSLADFIRGEAKLTGTHLGCEHGVCGACTVRVDGATVRSCLLLAIQCEGSNVETVEGFSEGRGRDLQEAFIEHNALQCGFCTAGILMTVDELLSYNPIPTREEIRNYLSGNYCRCTGYQAIVDAVMMVADNRRQA
jgi:carbon-monoxide dehydrogenase small subunit